MTFHQVIALLVTLTALFAYSNRRFVGLPTTIGVMVIALVLSLVVAGSSIVDPELSQAALRLLSRIDFDQALLQGMLSFLLFAGALHVDLNALREDRTAIGVLAVVGVILSIAVFGTAIYGVLWGIGIPLPFVYCLLFGAIVSPTDPIAVLGVLREARVPKRLETRITGESLFNDGIGVVAFLVLHEIAAGERAASFGHAIVLFLVEAVGGAVVGIALGYVTYRLLRTVDDHQVEILLTLALVMGGYALAQALHTSGPIAIVVAGLLIGNHGRAFAMSERTRERLDSFWELVDEILNAVLFVLIGLEILVLTVTVELLAAGLAAIVVLLFARATSVGVPLALLHHWQPVGRRSVAVLVWAGLRGGISVALALSLPASPERETILAATYVVVVFSVIVQGLTLGAVVRRAGLCAPPSSRSVVSASRVL